MAQKSRNFHFVLLIPVLLLSLCFIIFAEMWYSKEQSRTRLQTVEVLLKQKQETLLASYRSNKEQLRKRDNIIKDLSNKLRLAETRIQNMSLQLETRRNRLNNLPMIYAITPTYTRAQQKAELTRLSQTFLHLSKFHWIVVEDSKKKTRLVDNLLRNCGVSFTHLCVSTPSNAQLNVGGLVRTSAKGVEQRNIGISWLRKNVDPANQPGVVYFADDDNTYDLRIFAEMRRTRKISVWPVGLVGDQRYTAPIVKNGKVTRWRVSYDPIRNFATDMAGFAMNLQLFFKIPDLQFSHYTRPGSQESYIISKTNITLNELEPLADNCTKVLVWHTRTRSPDLTKEDAMKAKFGSDFIDERYEKCSKYLIPKEDYFNTIESMKNASRSTSTKSRQEYYLLTKYEIMQCEDVEKLIRKSQTPVEPVLYYVTIEEESPCFYGPWWPYDEGNTVQACQYPKRHYRTVQIITSRVSEEEKKANDKGGNS